MSDEQVNNNPAENVSEGTVENEGGQAVGEEIKQEGAPTSETGSKEQDSFTNIDPNTLPDEVKSAYKNMQADYTRKAQELAEERKSAQDWRMKADMYDRLNQDKRFVDYWTKLNDQSPTQNEEKAADISEQEWIESIGFVPDNPQGFIKMLKKVNQTEQSDLQKRIEAQERELKTRRFYEMIDDFSKQPAYKNYDKYEKWGMISYQLKTNPPKNEKELIPKLQEAYKNAEEVYNSIYQDGMKAGKNKLDEKVGNSTIPSGTSTSGSVYDGPDPRSPNFTMKDAYELAKKGVRVPR